MPSLNYNKEETRFLEFYKDNLTPLLNATTCYQGLVKTALESYGEHGSLQITSRLKKKDECIRKFQRKYRTTLEQQETAYEIRSHISDLIGLRVVCIYSDEIAEIVRLLSNEFDVLEKTDKISQIQATENVFGYQALHMDLRLGANRIGLSEYKKFPLHNFEVQIRTIIQDSWSVVDHKIKYKKNIPIELKRRINVLSALFELADREFLSIRNENIQLIQQFQESIDARDSTILTRSKSLDALEFAALLGSRFPEGELKTRALDRFLSQILMQDTEMNVSKMLGIFDDYFDLVVQYQTAKGLKFNPFTFSRHVIFLSDQTKFGTLLYTSQREHFTQWLETQKEPK
jgi:putative GTP pyrophosphokinase